MVTPDKVGEIYQEIPENELWFLEQTQKNEVEETIRILYNKGHKDLADAICKRFAEANSLFLRPIYEKHQILP